MLLVGIVVIVIASLTSAPPSQTPTESRTSASPPTTAPTASAPDEFVDGSVADRGWVPEPVTTDADVYVRAALAAASTFDTTLSSRPEWLTFLDSWFTPDTRYTSEADRESDMRASQLELRQGVVLPEAEWDSLAKEAGRVSASIVGDIDYQPVPEDASGAMQIATADAVLTFTRTDGNGGETSYDETARVSVQVLCGEGSMPTPDTSQQPGDCKVVRFFSGQVEP